MLSNKNRIEEILKNGYQIRFESVFELAFKNYRKIVLYAGLLFLVFAVLAIILSFFILLSYFGVNELEQMVKPENLNPEQLTGNTRIAFLLGSALLSVVLSPFIAGFIKMAYCAEKDEEFQVSNVFDYYKSVIGKELIIATLVLATVNTGLPLLTEKPDYLVAMNLVSYVILFITFMTVPLIIFGNLKAIAAIKASIILFFKNPLQLFSLIFVGYIFSAIGAFLFYIGIFFTLPFLYSMQFAVYNSIVGFDIDTEDDFDEIK